MIKANPFSLLANLRHLALNSPIVIPAVSSIIKFDEDGLKDTYSKFISTLKNTYNLLRLS